MAEERSPYEPRGKKATNVSIDRELLEIARELGINLSETLEKSLYQLTREERERRWREANRAFIDSHNKYVEEHGLWCDDLRPW